MLRKYSFFRGPLVAPYTILISPRLKKNLWICRGLFRGIIYQLPGIKTPGQPAKFA